MLKSILGFIWLLPATILVWLFYILPLLAVSRIKYYDRAGPFVLSFEVIKKDDWYGRAWHKWAGWSGPCVYLFRRYGSSDLSGADNETLSRFDKIVRKHELRHCDQQFWLGVLFYPAYFFSSAWILISNLWKSYEEKKHAYLFNIFEMDARKHAGQVVDVPRNQWPDGPDDYVPWV